MRYLKCLIAILPTLNCVFMKVIFCQNRFKPN